MEDYKIDPHKYPGPLEDLEKKRPPKKDNMDSRIAIMVALILLVFGGMIALYVYSTNGEGIPVDEEDATTFFPFIPIWIAIFIPLFAFKKNKSTANKQKRMIILAAVGVALLVAIIAGFATFLPFK